MGCSSGVPHLFMQSGLGNELDVADAICSTPLLFTASTRPMPPALVPLTLGLRGSGRCAKR